MRIINKKIILFVIVGLVVAVGVGILSSSKFRGYLVGKNINQPSVHEMAGLITEVKDRTIVVEGRVAGKTKPIEFSVTYLTILKHSVSVITAEQMKSGKEYNPRIEIRTGKIADLKTQVRVLRITSREDLMKVRKAVAVEIIYSSYEFPPLK